MAEIGAIKSIILFGNIDLVLHRLLPEKVLAIYSGFGHIRFDYFMELTQMASTCTGLADTKFRVVMSKTLSC